MLASLTEDRVKIPFVTAFLLSLLRSDKDLTEKRRERLAALSDTRDKWLALHNDNVYTPNVSARNAIPNFPRGQAGSS